MDYMLAYNYVDNQVNNEIVDLRGAGDRYYGHAAEVLLFPDEDLLTDKRNGVNLVREDIPSMNQIIRLTKSTTITYTTEEEHIYYTTIDLHTTKI